MTKSPNYQLTKSGCQKSYWTVIFAVRAVITGVCVPVGASHAPPGMNAWFGHQDRVEVQRVQQVERDVRPRPAQPQDLRDAEVELVDPIAPQVVRLQQVHGHVRRAVRERPAERLRRLALDTVQSARNGMPGLLVSVPLNSTSIFGNV